MATTIGILSDTHLSSPDAEFLSRTADCFAEAQIILHAGDLTSPAVLNAFAGKTVYAVHGNMCNQEARHGLPARRIIKVEGFTIALTHGYDLGYGDLEERLMLAFPEADCIVYGHTHRPVCHQLGGILLINPGSFTGTDRHGAKGTYALLKVEAKLEGGIHQVRPAP